MYRFGITMRITNAKGYFEPRDSISFDWSKYMLSAFPDSQFVYIPNIEEKVIDYIKKLKIDVLILSMLHKCNQDQFRPYRPFLRSHNSQQEVASTLQLIHCQHSAP